MLTVWPASNGPGRLASATAIRSHWRSGPVGVPGRVGDRPFEREQTGRVISGAVLGIGAQLTKTPAVRHHRRRVLYLCPVACPPRARDQPSGGVGRAADVGLVCPPLRPKRWSLKVSAGSVVSFAASGSIGRAH
jgi:hypothetical protein